MDIYLCLETMNGFKIGPQKPLRAQTKTWRETPETSEPIKLSEHFHCAFRLSSRETIAHSSVGVFFNVIECNCWSDSGLTNDFNLNEK